MKEKKMNNLEASKETKETNETKEQVEVKAPPTQLDENSLSQDGEPKPPEKSEAQVVDTSSIEYWKQQNELLIKQLNEQAAVNMSQGMVEQSQVSSPAQPPSPPSPPQPQGAPQDEYVRDFIASIPDFDYTNPDHFNKVLNQAVGQIREDIMKRVPMVAQQTFHQASAVQNAQNEFYSANPDLRNFGNYIIQVGNQIWSQSPQLTPAQVLAQAGELVRKQFNLQRVTPKPEAPDGTTPPNSSRTTQTDKEPVKKKDDGKITPNKLMFGGR